MDSLSIGPQVAFDIVDLVGNTALDNPGDFTTSQASRVTRTEPSGPETHGDEFGFNIVPDGNWTIETLTLDSTTRKLILASTAEVQLLTVEPMWNSNMIDHLDVGDALSSDQGLLCHGKIHSTIHRGHFGATRTMVHLEWNLNRLDLVDTITDIYSRIEGHCIGPKFLAHVTKTRKSKASLVSMRHLTTSTLDERQYLSFRLGIV